MPVKKGQRFVAASILEIQGVITFKAPYATSFNCTVPKGSLIIASADQVDGAEGFEASPDNYKIVEELFVPEDDRISDKYDGFYLVFLEADIGNLLIPENQAHGYLDEEGFKIAASNIIAEKENLLDRYRGIILGTAVGDALGLPLEGLKPERVERIVRGSWRHRFLFAIGMISDDTDHTVYVAQSLLLHPTEPEKFARALAQRLRWWLAALPAGIGLATLKSILRLWIGFKPVNSGVNSAGNGPAMRAAPIGAFFSNDPTRLNEYIHLCTVMTHKDPRALTGARAVALITAWIIMKQPAGRPEWEELKGLLDEAGNDPEWTELVQKIGEAVKSEKTVKEFALELGSENGVSGYIYRTVPVAIYSWHRHFGDFERSLISVLALGGDTDTVGAITGALAGAVTGASGIPARWTSGIVDWPNGVRLLNRLATALAKRTPQMEIQPLLKVRWLGTLVRNIFFLFIVILHVIRRAFPPYK